MFKDWETQQHRQLLHRLLQHKLHKPTDAVDAGDLARVCAAWGFAVDASLFTPLLQER